MTTQNMVDVGLSGSTGSGNFVGATSPTLITPASLGVQQQALNMNSHLINNVTDPVSAQDSATKNYVDNAIAGVNPAMSVVAATTAALTVTYANGASGIGATLTNAGAQAAFSIDGQSPTVTQRVLIKNQASTFQNGVYTVTVVGTGATNWVLTRALDYDQPSDINSTGAIPVLNGTVNVGTSWIINSTVTTVGTDAITYTQFTFSAATLTTKGDLLTYSTTTTRLPVGSTNGQVLQVASGATTGLAYSTPTYPSASGTSRTIIVSNGTNNVYSTETWATPGSSGNLLTSDGTNWLSSAPPAGALAFASIATQVFTASGTYTPNAKMVYCDVMVVGPGGGGGGAGGGAAAASGGGGGGSGSFARGIFSSATIGASQTVTIGTGGGGGSAGNNAGSAGSAATTFGALLTGNLGGGGGGGASGAVATSAGGTAGASSLGSGTYAMAGAVGNSGFGCTISGSGTIAVSGSGAPSILSPGAGSVNGGAATAGRNAAGYGGGGSGAAAATNTTAAGGNGSAGICIVIEYLKS